MKLQKCIISMSYFATLLSQQETFRLSQLQSKIFSNKTNTHNSNSVPRSINQPQDLKIISPFYQRINQHPQNCKCMYHKRIRNEARKITKVKAQPVQNVPTLKENQLRQQYLAILPSIQRIAKDEGLEPQEFDSWKKKLSAQTLKNYYYDYLKSLANFSKFKRHQKLDCHNHAFEQFLKNNYLVILDRKKTQNQIKNQTNKYSHRNLSKAKTEGNIDTAKFIKKGLQISKENQTTFSQAQVNIYPSSRDGMKVKRIAFKSTVKQIELNSQYVSQSSKKEKKKFKKSNSNRPSFFGLIEDQQIIREICSRFIHQNKSQNKQAQFMMKQLIDADIEMYTKIMKDIEQNLEEGISLTNLDEQQGRMLVKIVLHKMSKEVQAKMKKDSSFDQKNNIIQDLCSRYGWSKDEKPIGLKQFWKISRSIKAFGTQKETKYRDQRSKSPFFGSSKDKLNHSSRISRVSRMSGFSKDKIGKNFLNKLNSQAGSNFSSNNLMQPQIAEQKQQVILNNNEFKMKPAKSGTLKKGALLSKKKKKKLSGAFQNDQDKKMYGLVRKQICFFQEYQGQKQLFGSDLVIKQEACDKVVTQIRQQQDRNSSIYSHSKNLVLRHMESNKKFLKRIENQLIGYDCNNLVIGIGTNLLTKRRKIRAIYNAIQPDSCQEYLQSSKYSNLLKYLEIYEEYCDLIVKMKKESKTISQASMGTFSGSNLQQKEGQAEQINNLIADLNNERQLKYFYLKWLEQKDDPKQQLILKMPQKAKFRQGRLQDKKKTELPTYQAKLSLSTQKQESIIQKGLEEQVNVYFQMGNFNAHQKSLQKQNNASKSQKLSDFESKIINYRKMLKLQENEWKQAK